ncbi:hypothetical protein [Pseudomonas silesiensis]|uniref:hypothetical protein n=1 Tax=Pseudomonas silesiensis TaxID=1853130 RepID=UPI0030DC6671
MGVNEDSPWKEAKLFVNDREIAWGEPIALFRGEDSEVRVEVPSGIEGALSLGLVNDDELTIRAEPALNSWVPGGDGKFTWKLTPDAGKSGRVQLVVLSREVDDFWDLPCWVISSSLADEVEEVVVADYNPPLPSSANDIFFRDEPRYVSVSYKQDSPLRGYPLQLIATPLTGVQPSNLNVNPSQPTTVHAWWMTANSNSGTFSLELTGVGMNSGIALPAFKVMSRYLKDEAEVLIGGTVIPAEGIDFVNGSLQIVSLRLKPGSPLAGHPVKLKHTLLDLRPEDLISDPAFDNFLTEYRWTVIGLAGAGRFQLSLEGQSMTQALDAPVCKLLPNDLTDVFNLYNGGEYLGAVQQIVLRRNTSYNIRFGAGAAVPNASTYWAKLDWAVPSNGNVVESDPEFGVERNRAQGGKWEYAMKFLETGKFMTRFWITTDPLTAPYMTSILTIIVE